jgi:hypothetical protein
MVIEACRDQKIELKPFAPHHDVACIRAAETSDALLASSSSGIDIN